MPALPGDALHGAFARFRAVGKIRAESATSSFLRDSLTFGIANQHFGVDGVNQHGRSE
jgi:hypothetical protein